MHRDGLPTSVRKAPRQLVHGLRRRQQELLPTLQRTLVPLSSVRCMYLHAMQHTRWGKKPGMHEEQLAPELQPHPRYSCACRPSSWAAVRPAAG